jgi:tol-pal system protein YbgF
MMKNTVRFLLPLLLVGVSSLGLTAAAQAQSAAELSVRMSQVEEQMRQLIGQVEQLNYQMQQMQAQLQQAGEKKAAVDDLALPEEPSSQTIQKKQVAAAPEQGIEQIGEPPVAPLAEEQVYMTIIDENGQEKQVPIHKAPGPKILGTLSGSSENSGEFQGKVLVAPGGQPVNSQALDDSTAATSQTGVETVALEEAAGDSAERLYERSYESLLRRRFGDAESGFRSFLEKNRGHSLAGNAQYWLGETYYVQGDYKQAAQAFLVGYKEFPKSRKAADSLLKLGLSLNRLGQKEQACASYAAVGEQFPKAAEARKRAQTEMGRAGC